ncbi:FG-GAP repeat domain-containing protein [Streptomyces sp. NPDC096205]|uniref:FG-GAP repeat domain-containing protein n=1 Tax=Streptomyces sp. NPDC096205 TaxID=3366081 RepID=UPI003824EA16
MRRTYRLAALSAVLTLGLSTLLPAASAVGEEAPQETVVPATMRSSPLTARLSYHDTTVGGEAAGAEGVVHWLEGSGVVWTRYSDGRSHTVPAQPPEVVTRYGTGTDVLASRYSDGRVELWNAVDGTTRTLHIPEGHTLSGGVIGSTAITYVYVTAEDGTTRREFHLLSPGPDGSTRDVVVSGMPEGMNNLAPRRGDARELYFSGTVDGSTRLVSVDAESGLVRGWTPSRLLGSYVVMSADHVVAYNGSTATKAYVYSRTDLSAPPVEVPLDTADGSYPARHLSVVGDWLVRQPSSGKVIAVPIGGGTPVTLLASSNYGISVSSYGSAVVVGGSGYDDWGIRRIQETEDGKLVVTKIKDLPIPPYRIRGLALDQGRLLVAEDNVSSGRGLAVRTVAPTGTPEFSNFTAYDGERALGDCPTTEGGCRLHGTADSRAVWLTQYPGTDDQLAANGPRLHDSWMDIVPDGGQVTDVSGRYLIHTAASRQTVFEIGGSTPVATRPPRAAALSGHVLWSAGTTPGNVTLYNLVTKKTAGTVTTDAGCVPTELQSVGRYLYWTCDGRAGVYDRTAKKSVRVPAGEAKLGDGFVVTHDKQAGKLTLTTVAGGAPVSRVIGDLPDTGVSQRDVRWTVDEAGANAAYVDGEEQVHLVPSGVPQQPLRLLTSVESPALVKAREVGTPDTLAAMLLSKPSVSWRLTVRNKVTGQIVDTRSGGAARGELRIGWAATDAKGAMLPHGTYVWTLEVAPADGVGAPLQVGGTVEVYGKAPYRDHSGPSDQPDGVGDLLTLSSSGLMTFHKGNGKGAFSGTVFMPGWSTKVTAVPFGDLDGDRYNDALVRMPDGSLRGYTVPNGSAPMLGQPYKNLGTGWNAHNVLTSPGDLTGDKRPDLLARRASTGDLYLYAAKSDGTLASARKIASGWGIYTKVVGAGDLTGDGIGDVLARDRAGALWRYDGTGTGVLKGRVKVFSSWGVSYNAVVGVGDITGDGKADLVARDTAGNLYRQSGTGKGSFGARVKIGSGWQGYKGLF